MPYDHGRAKEHHEQARTLQAQKRNFDPVPQPKDYTGTRGTFPSSTPHTATRGSA